MGEREPDHDTFTEQVLRIFKGEPPVSAIDWQKEWRRLAALTAGLEAGDPRLAPVMRLLGKCDDFFLRADAAGFTRTARQVEEAMRQR